MKSVHKYYSLLIFITLGIIAVPAAAAQSKLSPADQVAMTAFERRAKEYTQMREGIEDTLPGLPTDASANQIETHKKNFQAKVLAARTNAKQGDIFTPEASALIRKIIKNQYPGKERIELRKELSEAENKDVAVAVNVAYPDSKEQLEMPPALLLALPQLPKQLRYRFVGTNLLLLDRENGLIVDYLTNAIP
jgi:hypothetical protein